MRTEKIEALAEALAKAQGEIRGAQKDGTNPHLRSRYVTLESVWDACRGPLSKHGLSVTQTIERIDGTLYLVTTLLHASGQCIDSVFPWAPPGPEKGITAVQALGSYYTYLRRYQLAPLVGVTPTDDDDGNSAGRRGAQESDLPGRSMTIEDLNASLLACTDDTACVAWWRTSGPLFALDLGDLVKEQFVARRRALSPPAATTTPAAQRPALEPELDQERALSSMASGMIAAVDKMNELPHLAAWEAAPATTIAWSALGPADKDEVGRAVERRRAQLTAQADLMAAEGR